MKTMFDTSVLVAAMVSSHQHHDRAARWLLAAHRDEFPWFIAAHSLAECYSTLTATVRIFAFPPPIVAQIIQENLTNRSGTLIELSVEDYKQTIARVAGLGLTSGMIYDALLTTVAAKAGIERLLTFNDRHFRQVWPEGAGIIAVP